VSDRGAVLRRYLADGTLRWKLTAPPGLGTGSPVAIDASGDVLYGAGDAVVKLDRDGQQLWQARVEGAGVVATALEAVGDGAVVRGQAGRGPFLAALSSNGAVRWVRTLDGDGGGSLLAVDGDGRSVVVTRADGCAAAMAKLDASGASLWSRSLARSGCNGGQLGVHGVAVLAQGRIVAGGALAASADFGAGPLAIQATDGFIVALSP
jgi:outer membrane protein assembly factor BamB